MEDPFVKRMMERTKARNKVLGRVTGTEKKDNYNSKNSAEDSFKSSNISKMKVPEKISNSDRPKDIASDDEPFLLKKKIYSQDTNEIYGDFSRSEMSQTQSSLPQKRYNKLALVSKRLDEWEDDYSYHSVCRGVAEKEDQGFTPSQSKSRLSYEFERDRSPLKEKNQVPSNSIAKKTDITESQPPKIISFLAKSPGSSPQKKRQNRASSPVQNRARDQSPSKVCDLRSRWEQHIRNSSPERSCESASPNRKNNSPSPSRKLSQTKIVQHSSTRSISPMKSHPTLPNLKAPLYCDSSKSCGNIAVDSHKLTQTRNIVKSSVKMPDTVPLIENPSTSSVKEKIAVFSSYKGPLIKKKDPAEMSVQDRKNIFENKKGGALIPKAPFGQNASSKVLLSGSSSKSQDNISKPTDKIGFSKLNKTYICEPSCLPVNEKLESTRSKSFQTHKKHFYCNDDDKWKLTDINAKNMEERKQEMQILLNRFHKPQHKITAVLQNNDETESEYPQSDESSSEFEMPSCGPPKPPRVVEDSVKSISTPQIVVNCLSPSKRMNSTELGETCSPSPRRREYVPRVKPGCLFPSLSDIESHSEAVESHDEDDINESSFAESILTSASIDSLGKYIQKVANPIESETSHLSTFSEGFKSLIPGDSALEAIAEIDNALDEAFSDDEPTPPKRRKEKEDINVNSFKTPKLKEDSDDSDNFQETSLAHSISMYRKQKPAEVNYTPVRQLIGKSHVDSPNIESPISPSVDISARIRVLQEEEELQLTVISQASSAINVVTQQPEQHGTPQHVEAEKLLLLATKKRQAALDEIQRLKAEGALGKRNHWMQDEDSCRGSISISNIALPLKQSFINKELKEHVHHLLVLVRHRDQLITSQMQKTPGGIIEGAISFPNLMALHNLTADFNISLEVYSFKVDMTQVAHHKKDFKKEHSRMILTPLKRLQRESRLNSPAIQSPGVPYSVRSSSFALIGFANLNINTLTRNAWTLEKVPYASPLDGHLLMRVSVSMEGGVIQRSFLTMFEDVGGFGAWNRRWCVLAGPFLRYWSYPDDEIKKECVGHLDLRMCTTRKVELVSRDTCARQFTFQLTTVRPATKNDKTDLVHEVRHNTVISRILLSADGKEERILWCNKLNKALANIRAWDPDALRPEDYHV